MPLDATKLNQLAANYDPTAFLAQLKSMPPQPLGVDPNFVGFMPGEQSTTPPQEPGAAPLSPQAMAQIQSMMPHPSVPHFAPGAAPRPSQPMHISPNVMQQTQPVTYQPRATPSLAQLLGMK